MGARLTVKSYKDAEAGANCQIIAVTQCAAYSFTPQKRQGIDLITILKSFLKSQRVRGL